MVKLPEDKGFQAFRILQFAFFVAPILVGLDKFFNFLTYWPLYLSPWLRTVINYQDHSFMTFVGIVEIVIGLGVFFRPKVFAYVLCGWLLILGLNLLLTGQYFDIVLRDTGLALGALALGKLSQKYSKQ